MAPRRKPPTRGRPRKKPRKKPESLRLRSLSPTLTVADIQASMDWYQKVLLFTLEETWEHAGKVAGASMKAGSVQLMLTQDDWAKGRDRVKGEGFRMYLSTAQDVDALAAGIKARGGTLTAEPADMPWGTRTFSLVDPDGFKLTIATLS
ncbi:MAG TPA: VOC family protein [Gemmatimonadales bacterium]|nr:VOC family protein [Gemmatimonadales bacterium]